MTRHHVILSPLRSFAASTRGLYLLAVLTGLPSLTPELIAQTSLRRVPQDFRTIQSAIDAAQEGDTVLVDHGMYHENIVVDQNIVLGSRFIQDGDTAHISRTVIDGSRRKGKDRATTVIFEGHLDTTAVLAGFTITGGSGTRIPFPFLDLSFTAGGGVLVHAAGGRVSDNIVTRNAIQTDTQIGSGGGIAAFAPRHLNDSAYFIIERNYVAHNTITGVQTNGGGIALGSSGRISSNRVEFNEAHGPGDYSVGGGICPASWNPATMLVEKNFVRGNLAERGGGIASFGRVDSFISLYITIRNNLVWENTGTAFCGGIAMWQNAVGYFINNTVVRNTAGISGSGIAVNWGQGVLLNNIVYDNVFTPQISTSRVLHAYSNVVEEPLTGVNTYDTSPYFLDDQFTSVAPQSPILGRGTPFVYAFGQRIEAPVDDIYGFVRRPGEGQGPDIGAIEYDIRPETSTPIQSFTKISVVPANGEDKDPLFTIWLNDTIRLADRNPREPIRLTSLDDALVLEFPSGHALALATAKNIKTFPQPPKTSITYMLKGRDDSFRHIQNSFHVYSDFQPGMYELQIRTEGTGSDSLKTELATFSVEVPPPWWRSTLFFIAVGLTTVVLVIAVYVREIRRNKAHRTTQHRFSRLQIESQEAERKRLAGELHDGLGQNLLLASNEIQQILRNGNGSRQELLQAEQLLQESIQNIREISANLHPHQLDRLGFTTALESVTSTVSRTSSITVTTRIESIDGLLPKDAELQLYRIIQEALSNVVKHAEATEVRIEIWRGPKRIDIAITDDGKGFDPLEVYTNGSRTPGGFGLSSMTERARIIGGSLDITSSPGNGTGIFLRFTYD